MNYYLYWKYPGGILLNLFLENESPQTMKEFHQGVCGGHHSWKVTTNKIMRVGFYYPTMFYDVYKEVTTCHEWKNFYGKRKLIPLPLNHISAEAPFQQWGLDFIGEINPYSVGQHKWILIATDYFTKWIEAIPTRRDTHVFIMDFLQNNIFSRFGCPRRLVTDNASAFK